MDCAKRAVAHMRHLVTCPAHGYSQKQRWGDKLLGVCTVIFEGLTATFFKGDRDCSSSIVDSWTEAVPEPFKALLAKATYTGNIKEAFVASGLFEVKPMSFTAQPGDIYWKSGHVAMCTSAVPDMMAEFSISENNTIFGKPGDQTGRESRERPYQDEGWTCIIHYNGKADSATEAPHVHADEHATRKLRVFTREHGWLEWVTAHGCEDNCGDDFAGVAGCWIYGVEAKNCGRLTVERMDGSKGSGGEGSSPIVGIHLSDADYQAHWLGNNPEWGKVEHDDDDDGAGKDKSSPLDMIRLLN